MIVELSEVIYMGIPLWITQLAGAQSIRDVLNATALFIRHVFQF